MNYKIFLLFLFLIIISSCNKTPECKEINGRCCIGDICNEGEILCDQGFEPVFLGCDENCMIKYTCAPVNTQLSQPNL